MNVTGFANIFVAPSAHKNWKYMSYWKNLVKKWILAFFETKRWLTFECGNTYYMKQERDTNLIPVIIINFNQLFYLRQLVNFLLARGTKNIIIIDNCSTYPPLLEYYRTLEDRVTIHRQKENLGYLVFWKNKSLYRQYGKGYYIITDADIIPGEGLPTDYIEKMLMVLKQHKGVNKVGFALRLDDIPDHFALKAKVLSWESRFWDEELAPDTYRAIIDTTFALYKPGFYANKILVYTLLFHQGIRLGGRFIARHGGWYVDHNNLTEEEKYYRRTANSSHSWQIDTKKNDITIG